MEERFKKIRKYSGLSQSAFAEKIGVSRRSVQIYEKDASSIPINKAREIAHICNISEKWFILGEGTMHVDSHKGAPDKASPIDSSIQILDEAEKETGIKLNPKQREAVAKILREELKKKELESKDNIITMMKAFKE